MRTLLSTLMVCLFLAPVFAQSKETLTNKSIIDLTSAGLSTSTIVKKINSSSCNFTTSTDDLIALKKAGVKEEVIDAMVNKGSDVVTSATENSPAADNNDDDKDASASSAAPAASSSAVAALKQQGSGIYYQQGGDITEVDATVFSQEKNGGNYWATYWSYGFAKSKKVMSVSSAKANVQFDTKKPVFYFYFDPENKSLNAQGNNSWYANASSPNEFLMVEFKVVKNARAVTTASRNSYESAAGIDDEFKRSFKYKKLEKGIYEVYFEEDLKPGQYGFMYAGAAATNSNISPRVYDFGIK